jgi:hypothetical protein
LNLVLSTKREGASKRWMILLAVARGTVQRYQRKEGSHSKVNIVVMVAFIPLNYKDTNIGKLFIEVYLAGTAGYGVGGVGSNGMAGGYGLMTAGIGFYSPDVSGGYQTMGGGYQTMGGYPQKNRGFIQPGRSF